MEFVANVTNELRVWKNECGIKSNSITATYSVFFIDLLLIHLATKFLHEFLRRYSQPRIISDFVVGMVVGNVGQLKQSVSLHVGQVLQMVGEYAMMSYMFVLGLEMEPDTILKHPGWEAIIAYIGIFSTIVLTFAFFPVLVNSHLHFSTNQDAIFVTLLALALANTSSPILTRITTDLHIDRSHFGRLVIGSAIINDMVTTTAFAIFATIARDSIIQQPIDTNMILDSGNSFFSKMVLTASAVIFIFIAQTMFIAMVVPRFAHWVNGRNPEGKPLKGIDLALSLALVFALTQYASYFNFNPALNSFLVGLAFPKEGRISNMLLTKLNFLISTFGLPYYLCHIGLRTSLRAWTVAEDARGWLLSLAKLALVAVVGSVGKIVGTLFATMLYGFELKEAIAMGLLLNVKGYLQIFAILLPVEDKKPTSDDKEKSGPPLLGFGDNSDLVIIIYVISTIVYVPAVVRKMVKRVKVTVERPRMTLQGLDLSAEIHILVGILTSQNVPMAILMAEAMRSRNSQLTLYAMDLVELNDRTAAVFLHGQEETEDATTMEDEELLGTRVQISQALEKYVEEGEEGITVVRLITVSSFYNMHSDICHAGIDTGSVFIVMPFHRSQRAGGGMEMLHPGFRQVNRKVLQHAPCSVGILVDRSLSDDRSRSSMGPRKVAVIFIGGCDDREALHFAGRLARQPGFTLTTVRFLPESGAETLLARTRGLVVDKTLQEKEMQLDDECFARFFESHIAGGRVSYLEKYVGCGADAVVVLRALEGQYDLFVVGRGGSRNPVLIAGLGDWSECPELGPIGDILASADFSDTASVLVVQQHDVGREDDSSDDEPGPT